MKSIPLAIFLVMFSVTAFADQTMRPDGMGGWIVNDTGGCGGLYGAAQGECIANREIMQQQQQQLQLQQLQQQKQLQQQQVENQRLQNELLRRKLEDQQRQQVKNQQEQLRQQELQQQQMQQKNQQEALSVERQAKKEAVLTCDHNVDADPRLIPLRSKIALTSATDIPFAMLANQKLPTSKEAKLILIWGEEVDKCWPLAREFCERPSPKGEGFVLRLKPVLVPTFGRLKSKSKPVVMLIEQLCITKTKTAA